MAWTPQLPTFPDCDGGVPTGVVLVRTATFSVFAATPCVTRVLPRVALVHGLATPQECATLVKAIDASRLLEPKLSGSRYCLRAKLEAEGALTASLWRRFCRTPGARALCPRVLGGTAADDNGGGGDGGSTAAAVEAAECLGLSHEVRVIRYTGGKGMKFGMHIDHEGRSFAPEGHTHFTFMVYLSDPATYQGGHTRFFEPDGRGAGHCENVIAAVAPAAGTAMVFRQSDLRLPHDGEVVSAGNKYLLRTDVVYGSLRGPQRKKVGESR